LRTRELEGFRQPAWLADRCGCRSHRPLWPPISILRPCHTSGECSACHTALSTEDTDSLYLLVMRSLSWSLRTASSF